MYKRQIFPLAIATSSILGDSVSLNTFAFFIKKSMVLIFLFVILLKTSLKVVIVQEQSKGFYNKHKGIHLTLHLPNLIVK